MSEEKKEILNELLFRIEAVKAAEDKKYVLMNAPTERLEEIIEVLPGMKSPTGCHWHKKDGVRYIQCLTRNVFGRSSEN